MQIFTTLFVTLHHFTVARFPITSVSCFTGTSIRSDIILTVGIDVTDRGIRPALVKIQKE